MDLLYQCQSGRRLAPFEELIASPAFHHWHHALEHHKDHNYSSMLPFMDRVFRTFCLPKRGGPAEYGIAAPMPSRLASGSCSRSLCQCGGPVGTANDRPRFAAVDSRPHRAAVLAGAPAFDFGCSEAAQGGALLCRVPSGIDNIGMNLW